MTASRPPSDSAQRGGAPYRGLSRREKLLIAAFLFAGLVLAGLLMICAPLRVVSEQDYRCPPAAPTASGEVSASCRGATGGDGIDDQALSQARTAARASFGVLSAALLAGSAAAIGVVVSNHNAALTREQLTATVRTNEITKDRDEATAARERERAADERFTTAIEQLGHPSASVRLGGMHSLHRLALSDDERLPTIVDVLCAYLRQPFHHPAYDWNPSEHAPDTEKPSRAWWSDDPKERDERDSEREVRSTATRLIPTLLPATSAPSGAGPAPQPLSINLRGAMLDSLDFSGRRIARLFLDGAHIDGDLWLSEGARIDSGLWLNDDAHIDGQLRLGKETHIDGDLWLGEGAHIGTLWLMEGAHIDGTLWLGAGAHIDGDLRLGKDARIGDLWLSGSAHIGGGFRFGDGAHIDGDIWLSDGAHIDGDLRLNGSAHIDGTLVLGEGAHVGKGFDRLRRDVGPPPRGHVA